VGVCPGDPYLHEPGRGGVDTQQRMRGMDVEPVVEQQADAEISLRIAQSLHLEVGPLGEERWKSPPNRVGADPRPERAHLGPELGGITGRQLHRLWKRALRLAARVVVRVATDLMVGGCARDAGTRSGGG
jgi:hypothetical protein